LLHGWVLVRDEGRGVERHSTVSGNIRQAPVRLFLRESARDPSVQRFTGWV
jgi:hypothetical protein